MKEIYFQFVNFIQELSVFWFSVIWIVLMAITLLLIVKFYKIYNGTQKSFEKISLLILALIVFAIIVFLTYVRI